jgi:hypothetical protein
VPHLLVLKKMTQTCAKTNLCQFCLAQTKMTQKKFRNKKINPESKTQDNLCDGGKTQFPITNYVIMRTAN